MPPGLGLRCGAALQHASELELGICMPAMGCLQTPGHGIAPPGGANSPSLQHAKEPILGVGYPLLRRLQIPIKSIMPAGKGGFAIIALLHFKEGRKLALRISIPRRRELC